MKDQIKGSLEGGFVSSKTGILGGISASYEEDILEAWSGTEEMT